MDLVHELTQLDSNPNLHAARILILLSAFQPDNNSDGMIGLTKLAKLDFLLRYPVMLERALEAKGRTTAGLNLANHELKSVESQMVRYRFGPWDHRYREFLNILVAKHLISLSAQGNAVVIDLTAEGHAYADRLREDNTFIEYVARSAILRRHFNILGTNLMKFLYDTFPEMVSLKTNEKIPT